MKKFELLRINDSLVKAMNYKNHEFAYAVFKNKQMVETFLQQLDFFNDVDPRYVEYENRRIALCKQVCKKDQNGEDVIKDGRYEIENNEIFQKEMEILHREYQSEISVRETQIDKLNEVLQEETLVPSFVKVKKEDLPTEIQTASELYEYSFMIE
jgi:hypothetical protein